jgi:2-(3-amino-3-carboxypropyl)histidine synthase
LDDMSFVVICRAAFHALPAGLRDMGQHQRVCLFCCPTFRPADMLTCTCMLSVAFQNFDWHMGCCRYDPYNRKLTIETYDHAGMRAVRRRMIESAATAKHWGVVLGTLGRQGNPRIVTNLQQHLAARGCSITTVLLSEVSPPKLAAIGHVDAWVQVACPRLSIDWGEGFVKPTLTPYEAMVALGLVPGWWQESSGGCSSGCSSGKGAAAAAVATGMEPYPMDYYAKDGGVWNSSYHKGQASGSSSRGPRAVRRAAVAAQ